MTWEPQSPLLFACEPALVSDDCPIKKKSTPPEIPTCSKTGT